MIVVKDLESLEEAFRKMAKRHEGPVTYKPRKYKLSEIERRKKAKVEAYNFAADLVKNLRENGSVTVPGI